MQTQSETVARQLPLVPQLARFGIVGACTAAVDFGLLYVLFSFARSNYFYAALVAFITASILNYLLSARYVFVPGRFGKRSEFTLFLVTTGAGLALNQLTMWLLVGLASVNYLLAKCGSLIIVTAWNFVSKKKIVFLD